LVLLDTTTLYEDCSNVMMLRRDGFNNRETIGVIEDDKKRAEYQVGAKMADRSVGRSMSCSCQYRTDP